MKNKTTYHTSPLTHFEMMRRLITFLSPSFFDSDINNVDFDAVYAKFNEVPTGQKIATLSQADKQMWKNVLVYREKVHMARYNVLGVAEDLIKTNTVKGKDDAKYIMGSSDDNMSQLLEMLHDFDACGQKMFRVEEQLQNELFMTDVLKIDDTFVHLPFPTICLYLPHNTMMRVCGQLVRYIYVSELEAEDGGRLLEVIAVTDDELNHMHVYSLDGSDVESQLKKQIGELYAKSPAARADNMSLVSFIIATLLYVNTVDSDQTSSMPKVVMPGKHSKLPMCSLGKHIVVQNGMTGMGVSASGVSNERMIHVLKWTVRGHFRKYKVGLHRSESKTIWIRPYLKGREKDTDVSVKPTDYVIK